MELLKKNTVLFLAVFLSAALQAQSTSEILDAFKTSYEQENRGEYNAAISTMKKVIGNDSYEINLRLGWLSYKAGKFSESKAYYSRAIELKPYAVEARFGIVYPASAQGKWDEVITHYEKILEIMPNNTEAHYNLGSILYGRKQYQKAAKHFEKVINLFPFDYDTLLMLAWTKYHLQDYGKATVLFNKVLMYNPADESALEGLELMK